MHLSCSALLARHCMRMRMRYVRLLGIHQPLTAPAPQQLTRQTKLIAHIICQFPKLMLTAGQTGPLWGIPLPWPWLGWLQG